MAERRVLIVVPALNEERRIGLCLQSLSSQSVDPACFRVVVAVDSETTDATLDVCAKHRCEVRLDDRFHTIGGALALAAEGASEEILIGTEADCVVPKDWIATIIQRFDTSTELVGLTGPVQAEAGSSLSERFSFWFMSQSNRILGLLFHTSYFPGMNYAYRMSAFKRVGGFNSRFSAGWDIELSIRIARVGICRFDRSVSVETSTRRLRMGCARNLLYYSWLFLRVNLGLPTRKPIDIRE